MYGPALFSISRPPLHTKSQLAVQRQAGSDAALNQLAGGSENESVMRRAVDGLMIRMTK